MNTSNAVAIKVPDRSLVKKTWIVLVVGWLLMLVPLPGTGILGLIVAGIAGFVMAVVNIVRGVVGAGILQLIGAMVVTPVLYFIILALFGLGMMTAGGT